jgi:hypothetical protein
MPVVAERFYPGAPDRCAEQLDHGLARDGDSVASEMDRSATTASPAIGGIAPHSGWAFGGRTAGMVFNALSQGPPVTTVVIFGAVHVPMADHAAICGAGIWLTPMGPIRLAELLAERVNRGHDRLVIDTNAHHGEHSIEVLVPFAQRCWPEAMLLPIMVPARPWAAEVGIAVARACAAADNQTKPVITDASAIANADPVANPGTGAHPSQPSPRVVFIASTDLTHYGPAFSFTPQGVGEAGVRWARDVNDRRMIDLMLAMDAEAIVDESRLHHNACGAGAVAATLAACREWGASRADLLHHTTSAEIVMAQYGEASQDSVGYAGIAIR